MTRLAEPLFLRRVRGPISSSPLLVDADGDGSPEIFVGGPVLQGLSWQGVPLPRWPKRAPRPFASSPAFGDIRGESRGAIVAGCDDGRIYAFHPDGERVPGWPLPTRADVYSTPALADLDGNGAMEVIVGSDDGSLRVVRGDGTLVRENALAGRPFVSASPTVADFDGDGRPEIAVGSWDERVHLWNPREDEPARPVLRAGHVIWSSATAFGIAGVGNFLAFAADRVYVGSVDGTAPHGWARTTGSWMASSPAVVELEPGDGASVIVGAERLYAWDLAGRPRRGWPVDVGDYAWSSPIAFDIDGDGRREVVVGSWDGGIHAFRSDGTGVAGFPLRTAGPVFSTPAAASLPEGGGLLVACSWDGTTRGWRLPAARFTRGDWLQFRGGPERTGLAPSPFSEPADVTFLEDASPPLPRIRGAHVERWGFGRRLARIVVEGEGLAGASRLSVTYGIGREERTHPVPVVNSRDGFVALVQPLRFPRRIRYRVSLESPGTGPATWPPFGSPHFMAVPSWWPSRRRSDLRFPSSPMQGRSEEDGTVAAEETRRGTRADHGT